MAGDKVIPIGAPRTVRDKLLETVGDVLARDGFDALTLETVAKASGLERAVILRYFKDLDALVSAFGRSAVFWPTVEELCDGLTPGLPFLPLRVQLAQYFKATIRGLLVRPRTLDILAWELTARNRFTRLLEVPRVRRSLEFFEQVTGEIPEKLDFTTVVAILGGAVIFLAVRSRQSGVFGGLNLYDATDRDRVDRVLEQLLAGVLREDGAR